MILCKVNVYLVTCPVSNSIGRMCVYITWEETDEANMVFQKACSTTAAALCVVFSVCVVTPISDCWMNFVKPSVHAELWSVFVYLCVFVCPSEIHVYPIPVVIALIACGNQQCSLCYMNSPAHACTCTHSHTEKHTPCTFLLPIKEKLVMSSTRKGKVFLSHCVFRSPPVIYIKQCGQA